MRIFYRDAINGDTIDSFIGVFFLLIPRSFKEKSWSVLLIKGYILNKQVVCI